MTSVHYLIAGSEPLRAKVWGGQAPRLPIAAPRRNSSRLKVHACESGTASRRGASLAQSFSGPPGFGVRLCQSGSDLRRFPTQGPEST